MVDVLRLDKMIIVKDICIMESVMNVIMDIILINLLKNVKIILILMKINVLIRFINGPIKRILEEMFLVLIQDQQIVNLLIKICYKVMKCSVSNVQRDFYYKMKQILKKNVLHYKK